MRTFLFFLAGSAFISVLRAQAPAFQWAKQAGGFGFDAGFSVVADASGNVYYTGGFTGVADFDPSAGTFNLNSSSFYNNGYLSKLTASGNLLWAKNIAQSSDSNSASYGLSLALDASGNVYLTGMLMGTVDLDPGPGLALFSSSGPGDFDFFISKFNAAGSLVWARAIGGSGYDRASSITIDNSGNVCITGFFVDAVDFDPGAGTYNLTTAIGGQDIFVLKLDATGNFIWARQMQGTTANRGNAVKTDLQGNVYVDGSFGANVDFDPGPGFYPISALGASDVFVSKLDASGNFVWAKRMGGANSYNFSPGMALDAAGNIFITGYFSDATDFDPGPSAYMLSPVGIEDVFVSKLNNSGNFVWAKRFGGMYDNIASSIALDNAGGVYCAGYFQDTVDFDPGPGTFTLSASGSVFQFYNINSYISKLDSSGNFIWAGDFGGGDSSETSLASIFVDASGSIYTTGTFFTSNLVVAPVDFDPGPGTYPLMSFSENVFVDKLNQCLVPAAPVNITPPVDQLICEGTNTQLTIMGSGTLSWFSTPAGNTLLTSGANYLTPTLSAGIYTFYAAAVTCTTSTMRTAITVTVSTCTDLPDEDLSAKLLLYPNPTGGRVTLNTGSNNLFTIEVYDAIGSLLLKQVAEGGTSQIDLGAVPKGIYILKLYDREKTIAVKKLVKQ